jgi:hypothetical protein
MYLRSVNAEIKAFEKLDRRVRAARALGVSNGAIVEEMKEAGVPEAQIIGLMQGRFIPRLFDDQFLAQARNDAIQQAVSMEDKRRIYNNYEIAKAKLRQIQQLHFAKRMMRGEKK